MYLLGFGKNEFSFLKMRYKLDKDEILVGRGKKNDINIAILVLSQKQFLLKNCDDHWEIVNLSRTNCTRKNNIPLPIDKSVTIGVNDIISIGNDGNYQLIFTDHENYVRLKEIHNMQNNNLLLTINKKSENEKATMLEDYLRCQICLEYFIKPVVTNCGHTFCLECLNQWALKTRYGGGNCPLCQHSIESTTRNVIVENCVEALMKQLPPDTRNEWNKIAEERLIKKRRSSVKIV